MNANDLGWYDMILLHEVLSIQCVLSSKFAIKNMCVCANDWIWPVYVYAIDFI